VETKKLEGRAGMEERKRKVKEMNIKKKNGYHVINLLIQN
jgi:hypothetical protein